MNRVFPTVLMLLSVFVLAFLAGTITAHLKVFPYELIRDGIRTGQAVFGSLGIWSFERDWTGHFLESTDIASDKAPSARWREIVPQERRFPVIATGGLNQYLDLCPENGCLAVAFDGDRKVTHTWPFRPNAIFDPSVLKVSLPREALSFDPRVNVYPVGIEHYDNGDILVIFQAKGSIFPFGMGISRIRPDGTAAWTRFDYSHHWPTLGANGVAYVPSLEVGKGDVKFLSGPKPFSKGDTLDCRTDRPQLDTLQILDGDGNVTKEVELVPLFAHSNWVGILSQTVDPCDVLHLNYIDFIGPNPGPGLAEGDLVLSFRNVSHFAIVDPKTWTIKRVVSGGFIRQHGVTWLEGSKFLIFDNYGGDAEGGASRVVELDLATGTERRLFPNGSTPAEFAKIYSGVAGDLSVSPDRQRLLVTVTHMGRVFEIDLATGRLLTAYDNLQDISSVAEAEDSQRRSAARYSIYEMSYLLN